MTDNQTQFLPPLPAINDVVKGIGRFAHAVNTSQEERKLHSLYFPGEILLGKVQPMAYSKRQPEYASHDARFTIRLGKGIRAALCLSDEVTDYKFLNDCDPNKLICAISLGVTATDNDIARLATWSKLQVIDISNTKITSSAMETLCDLPALRCVVVSNTAVTYMMRESFKKRRPECVLIWDGELDEEQLWDEQRIELQSLQTLRGTINTACSKWLSFPKESVGTVGIDAPGLAIADTVTEACGMFEVPAGREAFFKAGKELRDYSFLRNVDSNGALSSISLVGSNVTDDAIRYLANFSGLQSIFLTHTNVTDLGLSTIGNHEHLRILSLVYSSKITDDGMMTVNEYTGIEVLYLDGLPITDVGVNHLSNLVLDKLSLKKTSVTDKCIPFLLDQALLESLDLSHTGITPEGLTRLRKQISDCRG
jgi:hypothetical protein